jgi:hypothetical protein
MMPVRVAEILCAGKLGVIIVNSPSPTSVPVHILMAGQCPILNSKSSRPMIAA